MPNKIDIKRSSKSTGSILQSSAPNTQFVAIKLEWNFNMLKIIAQTNPLTIKWLTGLQFWNSNTLQISLRLCTSHPFLVWKLPRGCLCFFSILYFFRCSAIFLSFYVTLFVFISFPSHFPFMRVTSMSFHYLFISISFHCPCMPCPNPHR